jgi:ATP-dependent DNA helicase RecQ
VYNVFTNEQMAEMARRKTSSLAALGEISGVGAARLEKYGQAFVDEIAKVLRDGT